MQINRKTILGTAAVLGMAALMAGGTIAYFTDKESVTNTFTVGDVNITLYESQLHRENSGRKGVFSALADDEHYCDWTSAQTNVSGKGDLYSYDKGRYCTPGIDAAEGDNTTISAIANGHTVSAWNYGYKDSTIITDATATKGGYQEYFSDVASNIVPGQWVRKFAYVQNEDDSSDAYVLIRYMVPTSYEDEVTLKIPGTPYETDVDSTAEGVQGYFTAVTKNAQGEYEAYQLTANGIDDYTGYIETIDNVEYRVYAAVTTKALLPGEMTFWSPVNSVQLNSDVTKTTVAPETEIYVKVDAQAIQARTFSNAIEAINNL